MSIFSGFKVLIGPSLRIDGLRISPTGGDTSASVAVQKSASLMAGEFALPDFCAKATRDQLVVELVGDLPHSFRREIVGRKERLERQLRQRDIDRSSEHHGGREEAQDSALMTH